MSYSYPVITAEWVDGEMEDERVLRFRTWIGGRPAGVTVRGPITKQIRDAAIAAIDRFAGEQAEREIERPVFRACFDDEATPYKCEVLEFTRTPPA
jgi:hypothetical protein